MIALDEEMAWSASNVRARHIERIVELGVPLSAIAELGNEQAPFGIARVQFQPGYTFEPDPDGEPAVIMPVVAPVGLCEFVGIVDLLAFTTSNPSRWSWRIGQAEALGEHLIRDMGYGEPLDVVETPIGWLAEAGKATCILDWSASRQFWSRLRSVPILTFENETLKARATCAMGDAVVMPRMEIAA